MRSLASVAIVVALSAFCGFGIVASAQSPTVTISVTGQGATIDDARTDAVRRALQQTMKQLVVVDRAIAGNTVLRDRVMSTMNGYIERFDQKQLNRTATGFAMTADVTVSASRIQNFLGLVVGNRGEIEGSALFAEQNRRVAQIAAERAQAQARGEIFDRLFRGFPIAAVDLKVRGMNLSPRDPNIIVVDLEYSYKPTFIRALRGTLRALAITEHPPVRMDLSGGYNQLQRLAMRAAGGGFMEEFKTNAVCLGEANAAQCFTLQPGQYCASCQPDYFISGGVGGCCFMYLGVIGRFVDSFGQSANLATQCIVAVAKGNRQMNGPNGQGWWGEQFIEAYFMRGGSSGLTVGVLDLSPKYGSIEINSSMVNLKKAKYFVALPGISSNTQSFMTSVVPDGMPGCNLLDEAVQKQMLLAKN